MSTSTDLLLIHQQIVSLTTYMNWIIAGVTLTITVLIMLFGLIQFVYQRKLQKSDINELEKTLSNQIENKLQDTEIRLQAFSEKTISRVESELRKDINCMDADIARRFAIDCDEDNLPSTSFSWWLSAAAGYVRSDQYEMYKISITASKKTLEKIDSDFDRNNLFESLSKISENFDFLEKTHKSEVELLRDMFKDKSKPKQKETIQTIQA